MLTEKANSLKIETLTDSEEQNLLIRSRLEIENILQTVCRRNTRSALYYDDRKSFFLTILLAANRDGIWLDPASRPADNFRLLNSREIIFVSSHNQTKIQFQANNPWQTLHEGNDAIFFPLPQQLLRLQRRNYYRLSTSQSPVRCLLKSASCIMPVMDISEGGLSLDCREKDVRLRPGGIYPDCKIDLPEMGSVTATLLVKNVFEVEERSGKIHRRAGCEFIKPNMGAMLPLQRYVAQMQHQSASMMHQ